MIYTNPVMPLDGYQALTDAFLYIVHGSVSVLGTSTIVRLNLFDTARNKAVARETAEARR